MAVATRSRVVPEENRLGTAALTSVSSTAGGTNGSVRDAAEEDIVAAGLPCSTFSVA